MPPPQVHKPAPKKRQAPPAAARDAETLAKLPVIPFTFVDTPDAFRRMMGAWERDKVRRIAVDMEFVPWNQRLALVQIKDDHNRTFIVDAMPSWMQPLLKDLLEGDLDKVWFACASDLAASRKCLGVRDIANVIDLHIIGTCLGVDCSLDKTEAIFLGREVEESEFKKRMQRSNWGKRPLSEVQLRYCSMDVEYLFELEDAMLARLKSVGIAGIHEYAVKMNLARSFKDSRCLYLKRFVSFGHRVQELVAGAVWMAIRNAAVDHCVFPPLPAALESFFERLFPVPVCGRLEDRKAAADPGVPVVLRPEDVRNALGRVSKVRLFSDCDPSVDKEVISRIEECLSKLII